MRNWILASTLLTTAAISLLGFIISYISRDSPIVDSFNLEWKIVSLLICSLFAFSCMAQSVRYFNHTIVAINCQVADDSYYDILEGIEILKTMNLSIDNAGSLMNRGCLFFTFGLRFFYLQFPIIMFLFGPWFLLGTSLFLIFALHFVDGTVGLEKIKTEAAFVRINDNDNPANLANANRSGTRNARQNGSEIELTMLHV